MAFDPETALNADPSVRPDLDDMAGWLRFHAGGFYDGISPGYCRWGKGRWRYDGDCRSCTMQEAADYIEAGQHA